jgi:GT2 family glycosyltransferase
LNPPVTVSVVSHGQNALVNGLLDDLERLCPPGLSVLVTENVHDPVPLAVDRLRHPVRVFTNTSPRGFGANHNAAFAHCTTPAFCVVNPDIRLHNDPFPSLGEALSSKEVGVVGPLVRNPAGTIEDSARRFPTVAGLLRKLVAGASGPDYPADRGPLEVDWVAGMFMVLRSDAFRDVGGFDERFFLYYEDVDLCARLRARGYACIYQPEATVVHDARRASRRNVRLMSIHAASALRYLTRRYR